MEGLGQGTGQIFIYKSLNDVIIVERKQELFCERLEADFYSNVPFPLF